MRNYMEINEKHSLPAGSGENQRMKRKTGRSNKVVPS